MGTPPLSAIEEISLGLGFLVCDKGPQHGSFRQAGDGVQEMRLCPCAVGSEGGLPEKVLSWDL